MPTTIFDWIARTAMLVMAGLVTLSILGSIAAMTEDPGTAVVTGDRPPIEAERAEEREAARPPLMPEEGNVAAAAPGEAPGATAAAQPAAEDRQARWLEAIAYALLAVAGVGAIGVLVLWQAVRELRRIGDRPIRRPPP